MRSTPRTLVLSLVLFLLANPAKVAAIDFAAATSYPVGTSPQAIVVGDFNGDGKPDIAVANAASSNVSILLGNGDGTFQAARDFSAGNSPSSIAVGDFNGDGKLDLAVFQGGVSVGILLGNGDGSFQSPKLLSLSSTASFITVADFNPDRKSDLAVLDRVSGAEMLDIFIGNGDGTFQPAKQTPIPEGSAAFATADFNGDSKPDLALAAVGGVRILLGNGDGTFSQGVTVTVGNARRTLSPESVVTADLNHDGKADLIISSLRIVGCGGPIPCSTTYTGISTFLGNGDGTFQGEQIAASAIFSFRAGAPSQGGKIRDPIVGDFNGDGKLDLAYRVIPGLGVSIFSPSLQFLLGKGDGTFSQPVLGVSTNSKPLAEDVNVDKLTDLISIGTANNINVQLNTSPTSGSDLGVFSAGSSPEPVGIGRNLTFTAEVRNLGPHDATGATFTDTLPNKVNFVSATSAQGTCVQSQGIVSCSIGALPSAFDSKVSIVVTPTVAGAITNSMNVSANEPDPVSANNTVTQTADVVPVFTLTVTKTGNGAGTVTSNQGASGGINCGSVCSASYFDGSTVILNESPDTNSVLAGWSGGCTGTGTCAVTMTADQSVTANFVLGEKLSISVAGGGSGSVTSTDGAINCTNTSGNCSSLYAPGTFVSLTATPAGTSSFTGWSGACTGTNPSVCTVNLNSAEAVTATFNPSDFSIVPSTSTFTTQAGMQVMDALTLTEQGGFSGQVNLNCTVIGPPPLAVCSLSPSSVTIGASPGTSTLTISAPSTLAAFPLHPNDGSNAMRAFVAPFFVLLLGGIGLLSYASRRQRRTLCYLAGSVVVLAVLAGCGATTPAPPTQKSYTVTVNAVSASGSLQHSTTVVLTVQ